MKTGLTFLMGVCACFILNAQQQIKIEEVALPFSKGTQPAYQVTIPQTNLKAVDKGWQKYLKNGSKNKPESLNDEIVMHGAVCKNINAGGFNVYSKLLETTEGIKLTAWLTEDDSIYIAKAISADKNQAAQKYINDFVVQEYRAAVGLELEKEKDNLKGLEGELSALIKDEEKASKKINENDRLIDKAKNEIKANENEQGLKNTQIADQKKVVDNINKTPGADGADAEKVLKSLEGELKKIQKDKEKMHKGIDNAESDTRDQQRSIDKSKADQKVKNESIEQQKKVVQAVQAKLAGIK